MMYRLSITVFSILLAPFVWSATESDTEDTGSDQSIGPETRPRLYDQADMSPYRRSGMSYMDPWYYRDSPYFYYAYAHHGFGYRSDLYYDTFFGFLPEPGHGKLSVSVGSDNYFGTSMSTSGYLDKKRGITYNIATLWESGETYWSHRDYDSFTIAPSFFWSNENTSVYVGFEYTETHFGAGNMSPFRVDTQNVETQSNLNQLRPIWIREPSDYTLKSATVGLQHQLTDFLTIGLQVESSDIKSSR
jgi:hypothetical protein